jgi:hypothetical protein
MLLLFLEIRRIISLKFLKVSVIDRVQHSESEMDETMVNWYAIVGIIINH